MQGSGEEQIRSRWELMVRDRSGQTHNSVELNRASGENEPFQISYVLATALEELGIYRKQHVHYANPSVKSSPS